MTIPLFPLQPFARLAGCLALLCAGLPALAQTEPARPASGPGASASAALQLSVGRQHVLQSMMALGRLAVGDPNVLDVKVLRSAAAGATQAAELLLTPRAPGRTTLTVWPPQGLPQSWQIEVSAPLLQLERRLASVPEHAQALAGLRQHAAAQAPLLDRSEVAVRSNTVQVDVQVVEFKKTALRRAGINLLSGGPNSHGFSFGMRAPGGLGGSGGSGSDGSSSISSAMNLVMTFGKAFGGNGLQAQLGVLESNGLARVLARPTLVAHTGQNASFLAGGEIPIPVPSGRDGNITIRYKEFGVKLQLTPTILSDERIALKVAPESSDLDYTNGVTISGVSVPAVRVRRADTMVELADGESFVIGGLVSRQTISSIDKLPLLGDLPVLGAFFKNLNYSQDESELVIIVTPHLVHPVPAGTPLEAMLPGAHSEQRNASQVWTPFLAGGLQADAALPGFSY